MQNAPGLPFNSSLPSTSTADPFSQPTDHGERLGRVRHGLDSNRVTKSAPEYLQGSVAEFAGVDTLRAKVFNTIKERLHAVGVNVSGFNEQEFLWCLPKDDASASDWDAILTQPLHVTIPQVSRMFSLKQSQSTADKPPQGGTIFYVRTYSFKVPELLHLLQHLLDKGEGSDKPHRWITELQGWETVEDEDQTVFIRYIGMTHSTAAWKRFRDDLGIKRNNPRSQGFAFRFYRACLDLSPKIIEAALIQEFSDANVQFQAEQDILNLREQTLIALFGLELLLNSQHGGHGHHFEPNDDDVKQFRSLQSNTVKRFRTQLENAPKKTETGILNYAQNVQEYANKHPETTGAGQYAFQDKLRKVVEDQCLPAFVRGRGHSVLVTVGSEFTLEAYLNAVPFYKGGSGARDLVAEIFSCLVKWESGPYTQSITPADMVDRHYLPFINLFSWTKIHDRDQNAAVGQVREYLQAAKPLVALTFGQKVSSIAIGAFQHENGIPPRQLMDNVGSIFLSKYDEKATEAADQNCILVVPAPHPGANAYGSGWQQIFLRVLCKSISVAWLAADQAMKLSSEGPPGQSNRELCRRVASAVRQKTGPDTDWEKSFQRDKNDLSELWKTTRNWASSVRRESVEETLANTNKQKKRRYRIDFEDHCLVIEAASVRWKAAREELAMIMKCEKATSAPTSSERNAQSKKLNSLSLAPLRKAIGGTLESDEVLSMWLKTVPAGKQYYFAANNVDTQLEDIPNLLSIFLPEQLDADRDPWEEDAVAVREASGKLEAWVEDSIVKRCATYQDAVTHAPSALADLMLKRQELLARFLRERIIGDFNIEVYQGIISGKPVQVVPSRNFTYSSNLYLHWEEADGNVQKLDNLPVPKACTPLFPEDKRFIFFTRDGVDIRDENGESLGALGDKSATIPLGNLILLLQKNPLEKNFIDLWERETGLSASQILISSVDQYSPISRGSHKVYPKSFFLGGRSHPWDLPRGSSSSRKACFRKLINLLPIEPGDAIWLFNRFLDHEYPQGGELDPATPALHPGVDSVWIRLGSFLRKPLYHHHPQRLRLIALTEAARDPANCRAINVSLGSTLDLLRSPVEIKKYRAKRVQKLVYQVGPARAPGVIEGKPEPALEILDIEQADSEGGWGECIPRIPREGYPEQESGGIETEEASELEERPMGIPPETIDRLGKRKHESEKGERSMRRHAGPTAS